MIRGYLNSLSFPADTIDNALALLDRLRSGMAILIQRELMRPVIMCAWRAADLPLTAGYETLRDVPAHHRGQFRDTILFFLTTLDQRSPVTAELSDADQADADPHVIDGLGDDLNPEATRTLVACLFDQGVLLSIASAPPWQQNRVEFTLLTEQRAIETYSSIDNICDEETAGAVADRLVAARAALIFDNWQDLSGGALRSEQIDTWFEECRRSPGLEQAIMRAVSRAQTTNYRADGDLIKKLTSPDTTLFEIRIHHAGSNNVRLLFVRNKHGQVVYGYGGTKTGGNKWYDRAVPLALNQMTKFDTD